LVWVIAHRGVAVSDRENTVGAFLAAVQAGADGVELDVRATADGALVVHHDAVLPSGLQISNLPAAGLPDHLPTLDAALDACAGLTVNVEVKSAPNEVDWDPSEATAAAVARLIGRRGAQARTIVSSFGLAAIDQVRAVDPTIPTGWLTLPGYDQHAALETVAERGHVALHPHHSAVSAELVAAAHERGLAVNTWTVDDPARMQVLAAWGVDAIITNDVALALATLATLRQ
jgi:glycerophosphoryl diester phosphodiesterase